MNSREIVTRSIEFTGPERIGLDFMAPHPTDFVYAGWGKESDVVYEKDAPEIRRAAPDFPGKLYRDQYGNIWGRLNDRYGGEVIKGVLQDDWERLDQVQLPDFCTPEALQEITSIFSSQPDRYRLGVLPGFPFAIMRYMRRMDFFLQDVLLYEKEVMRLNERVVAMLLEMIDFYAKVGADGIFFCEDWGTQERLLVSPALWRRMFKPSFKTLADHVHSRRMHLLMHSCGWIYPIMNDLIEVGVDVLQLDQPELMGLERIAAEFAGRVTFYCPVDIQKVMQTGDKMMVQTAARRMLACFHKNGGFIAKDYPQWDAIDVRDEWAQWARDVFTGAA
jgi:uroporphyrinogen decarboxylase